MRLQGIVPLACKYIARYRRRYLFLFTALAFGFGIVTAITALKSSMSENVYNAAQSHYAGDVIVMGWEANSNIRYHFDKPTLDTVLNTIGDTGIGVKHIVKRNLYSHGIVFFNGVSIDLKYLIGVDWKNEKDYFNSLIYAEGAPSALGPQSIVVSLPIATALGAKIGDNITLELDTRDGQKNTATFILGATVEDSSIFGFFKAYIPLATMNSLIGFEPEDCGLVGVYLKNRDDVDAANAMLQAALAQRIQTADLMRTRDDFERESEKDWRGIRAFVMTVPVYLSEIAQILDALNVLIAFLYVMMLTIILVSAGVTYRLILHERTREIGTMRAIGFFESDIRNVLVCETMLLGTLSIIAGFCLSAVFTRLAGLVPFDWFPSFEIFLKNGRLGAVFSPLDSVFNIVAIYIVLVIAVWFPTYSYSRAPLPEMLAGSMKG